MLGVACASSTRSHFHASQGLDAGAAAELSHVAKRMGIITAIITVAWPSLEAPNNSCQREVGRAHGRERAGGCAWMAGQGLFEPFPAT